MIIGNNRIMVNAVDLPERWRADGRVGWQAGRRGVNRQICGRAGEPEGMWANGPADGWVGGRADRLAEYAASGRVGVHGHRPADISGRADARAGGRICRTRTRKSQQRSVKTFIVRPETRLLIRTGIDGKQKIQSLSFTAVCGYCTAYKCTVYPRRTLFTVLYWKEYSNCCQSEYQTGDRMVAQRIV